MKSMAGNRLRNGVFAAFFLLLAVYLGCYFLLLVTSGPYQPTDRMDAETAMRLQASPYRFCESFWRDLASP